MAQIKYVGPSHAVDIALPGGSVTASKGVAVEVPDALAESLLAQDIFEKATKAVTKENV